jgi:hypothetical protein
VLQPATNASVPIKTWMPRRRLTRTARTLPAISADLSRSLAARAAIDRNHSAFAYDSLVRCVELATVVLSLAIASPASAYVRTTVDGFPERPIFWTDRAISLELASGSSADVSATDLRGALDRSLGTWSLAGGCTDVVLTDVGEAAGLTTNLDGGPLDHHNRIVVRESGWPDLVGPETLALTTVMYDRDSGAILDSDTDLNGVVHAFSTSDPPPSDHDDVENTLTHELGHALGFAHSPDPSATMFASALAGETSKRDLAADDLAAICETYPTGRPTPTTLPPPASSSCHASPRRAPAGIAWLLVAWLLSARARSAVRRAARAAETAS